jgi:septum formation protein
VAAALALRKARAVTADAHTCVLAADTLVVAADGALLGKPLDAADARRILRRLSGTTHRVVTGTALLRVQPPLEVVCADVTYVTMRTLTDDEIDAYVASGESFGKAGAYAIQERGDRFVTSVSGSWSNVVGLPIGTVQRLLAQAGVAMPRGAGVDGPSAGGSGVAG